MVQRESYNGFAESISKSICDFSSGFQQILWVHEEGTPNGHHRDFNVRNINVPYLTNSSYPQPFAAASHGCAASPCRSQVACEEKNNLSESLQVKHVNSTVWIWCKQTGSISNFLHKKETFSQNELKNFTKLPHMNYCIYIESAVLSSLPTCL